MGLPKILILNQPFNSQTGGGITSSNLFAGWDKNKLAVVCQSYLLQNVNTNICDNYYQLGYKEHGFIFPFNLIKRKHYSGPVKFKETTNKKTGNAKSKLRDKIILDYFNPMLRYFGLSNNVSKLKLSVELCNWLDNYSPDVIYAVATTRESIAFILLVCAYLKKPLVFHMMDDWLIADKGLFKNLAYKKNDVSFKKLLNVSDTLMAISDGMGDAYLARYGKKFITFHNPIDVEFWSKYQRSSYELSNPPTLLYAGRIGLGIDDSLEIIAKTIQQVNNRLNLSMKFVLQTKEEAAWSSKYECVQHRKFVPYDELPKVFAEADFLILPYDFSPQSIKYIGYSMPTKASEYMISGTPIIIFSPKETALVNYAEKFEWAKVVTENNIDSLYDAFRHLLENKTEREHVARNAIKIAEKNHASLKVTADFREALTSLVKL